MRRSHWILHTSQPIYPSLAEDLTVDVVVVGAGIAGLTTALLLKRAGFKVVVIDSKDIVCGESGASTAHITELIDTRYFHLISAFGKEGAMLAARSQRAAIETISALIEELEIDCDFSWLPLYLYASSTKQTDKLTNELMAAQTVGISCHWVNTVPLPFDTFGGMVLENQAQFNPRKYLFALARAIEGDGCHIFANTSATAMHDGYPCRVETDKHTLTASYVVVATHSPADCKGSLVTKIAAYRTYALALASPNIGPPMGLYWDLEEPYHYIRRDKDTLIIGGADHKTGHSDHTRTSSVVLEAYAKSLFPGGAVVSRWSGQILQPVDGLPYIGEYPSTESMYVATGFAGNGITFGTISGMLISDLIQEKENPWTELYRPSRINAMASAATFIAENKDFPISFIKDRFWVGDADTLRKMKKGEGMTIRVDGKPVAVHRRDADSYVAVSAVCPHLGCVVHWNDAEGSWDCPCHGSRFDANGCVLTGPAVKNLEHLGVIKDKDAHPHQINPPIEESRHKPIW